MSPSERRAASSERSRSSRYTATAPMAARKITNVVGWDIPPTNMNSVTATRALQESGIRSSRIRTPASSASVMKLSMYPKNFWSRNRAGTERIVRKTSTEFRRCFQANAARPAAHRTRNITESTTVCVVGPPPTVLISAPSAASATR